MTPLQQSHLLSILYTALAEPLGLVLRTSDTTRARAALYKARTEAGDPELQALQLRVSPFPDGDLIIVKTTRPQAPTIEDLL